MPFFGKNDAGQIFQYTANNSANHHLKATRSTTLPPPVPSGTRSHLVYGGENTTGGTHAWTDAEVLAQAKAFDIITTQFTFKGGNLTCDYTAAQIASMKAANPNLNIIGYANAGEYSSASAYPSAYYAHDATGAQVKNPGFTLWEMQPDNAGWQAAQIVLGQARMSCVDVGNNPVTLDGQMADVLGDFATTVTPKPVNPATGAVYTSSQWYAMTAALAKGIVAANPGKITCVNGLAYGTKYMNASKQLFTGTGAPQMGIAEIFVRVPSQTTDARPLSDWVNELAMLADASARGKSIVCMAKDLTTASAATKTARLQFAFGTFLLANDGTHYFYACTAQDKASMTSLPWLSETDYGTPTGPYTTDANGCYYRSFTKSSIGVNPTSTARTMTVGGQTQIVAPNRAVFVVS